MTQLFTLIFYQPLFNALIFFTTLAGGSIGWSIILVTIAVRLLLYPLTQVSLSTQRSLQKLQPEIDALKKRYADNKEAFSRALMELYKQQKVNPFSSCMMVLVQLPILWALYRAFRVGLSDHSIPAGLLYPFVHAPETIHALFFGINLATPSIVMAVSAGIMQYLQARTLPRALPAQPSDGHKDEQIAVAMNKQMTTIFPIMTVIIGLQIPAGLSLYWAVSTLLLLLQQWRTVQS